MGRYSSHPKADNNRRWHRDVSNNCRRIRYAACAKLITG